MRRERLGLRILAIILVCALCFGLAACDPAVTYGKDGADGKDGASGKSAYELAVENGYTGTMLEWLASLAGEAGANGESAYEMAVKNGYQGSEKQWLNSLIGEAGEDGADGKDGIDGTDGANGKSAYELACENGFAGDLAAWLDSLVGEAGISGIDGKDGTNGKSAYDLAVENGFDGSITQWLASLVGDTGAQGEKGETGAAGKSAYELAVENGYTGTQQEWLASLIGAPGQSGVNGKSAYELAVENGYQLSEEEWLSSLAGRNGLSAYEIAVRNGFRGSEAAWLASLKGDTGAQGEKGDKGETGAQGVGVASAYVNSDMHLILVLTDGTEIDVGYVGVTPNYTVTFKNWDGTVLKTESVEVGKAATAPADPTREGYIFAGWDRAFNVITSDLVVTATYTTETTQPMLRVESVVVAKGTSQVTVNVWLRNNPGVMGGEFTVSVNDAVFGFQKAQKTGYPSLAMTYSGAGVTASPYKIMLDAMDLTGEDRGDGVLFSLIFVVKDTNATGTYPVTLTYDSSATFDENYNTIDLMIETGTITIE